MLKLTYGNADSQKFSGGNTPGPRFRGVEREGEGRTGEEEGGNYIEGDPQILNHGCALALRLLKQNDP